jgi:DNA-binding NarL/FixJ family response regulator
MPEEPSEPQKRRPRVLLADDHPGMLVALRRLLEPSCDVVESVSTGHEAVEAATRLKPDVIVLDLTLADLHGFDACRQIKEALPGTEVVIVTAAGDAVLEASAFRAGASAFLEKHSAAGNLASAILRIVGGKPGLV